MYSYDIEQQSRQYSSTVNAAHHQRKLETDARRQRQAQQQPATAVRIPSLWFRRLRLRLAVMLQPAEEPMIA